MLQRRAILAIFTPIAVLSLSLPGATRGGEMYIDAWPCWCDGSTIPQSWNLFPVSYAASTFGDCQLVSVAFRLQGVPDDPALMRRFDPLIPGSVIGDPFGDGAIIQNLVPVPGNTPVGYIMLFVSTALAPQVWSVEAHRGIAGFTTPVATFEDAPSTWVAQTGHSTMIGNANPNCTACAQLPQVYCPFAVEPSTWSVIKRIYQ
jgi:hypothetical protein